MSGFRRTRRTATLTGVALLAPVGALAAAVGLGLPPAAGAPAAAQERPDIVLVVTDDQRFDTLWAMPVVSQRLAGAGVTFPDTFVVNPLCCPSRASILTGDHSHTTLVYRQGPPFGRFDWFDDSSTLATWLDDAGYATGLFGKYLDGGQSAMLAGYVPPGWDRWVAFVQAAPYDYVLTIDGEVRRFGRGPGEHSTEVLAREAVAFVERTEGPMFLVFAPSSPHHPATPVPADEDAFADLAPARPPSFDEPDVSDKPAWVRELPSLSTTDEAELDAFRRDQYRALVGVDRAVGAILDTLEDAGRMANTLVVFTSDNGILHGEHRWAKKEAPYEEAIRVPLVVRWDAAGWAAPSALPGIPALNIDLAPTIAEAAWVAHPSTDGRSLLPVLGDPNAPWRSDFLIEHLEGTNPVPTYCAVRSERWKYVRYATGEEELYDLSADPYELESLAGDPSTSAVRDRMRSRLDELCRPAPPGFADRSFTRAPLAVIALVLLAAVEVARNRRSPGARRVGR